MAQKINPFFDKIGSERKAMQDRIVAGTQAPAIAEPVKPAEHGEAVTAARTAKSERKHEPKRDAAQDKKAADTQKHVSILLTQKDLDTIVKWKNAYGYRSTAGFLKDLFVTAEQHLKDVKSEDDRGLKKKTDEGLRTARLNFMLPMETFGKLEYRKTELGYKSMSMFISFICGRLDEWLKDAE